MVIINIGGDIVKIDNVIDTILISLGISVSLIDLQTILGIILLVIEIGWILVKVIKKMYLYLKGKTSEEEVDEEVNDAIENINKMKGDDK